MINPIIDKFGNKYWCNDKGEIHREDGPAVENKNGCKEWLINGILHREDGPAVEYIDGTKYWYINGRLHRENGPARESSTGNKEWFYNNEFIGYSGDGFTQEDFERYLKIKEYW